MKAKDIVVGMKVFMKVSGNVVPVRVDSIREVSNYKGRSSTVYACTNLKTGRPCSARSASKFRGPVPPELPTVRQATAMFDALDRKQEREQEGKQHADPTTPSTTPTATAAASTPAKPASTETCPDNPNTGQVYICYALDCPIHGKRNQNA